jgi:hypothetical protein
MRKSHKLSFLAIILLFVGTLTYIVTEFNKVSSSLSAVKLGENQIAVFLYTDLSEEEVEAIALEAFGMHLLAIEE